MSEGGKEKKKKERKKERSPSEQPRVSDPLMVVDTQSYAVSDVPLKKKKKKVRCVRFPLGYQVYF